MKAVMAFLRKRILVRLEGTLSEQLFQLCATLRLARRFETPAWVDPVATPQLGEGDLFSTIVPPASPQLVHQVLVGSWPRRILRYFGRRMGGRCETRLTEQDPELSLCRAWMRRNYYLCGPWQHRRHLEGFEEYFLRQLRKIPARSEGRKALSTKLREEHSIAIYLSRPTYMIATHPPLNELEPLRSTLDKVKACVKRPTVYLFTNDPAWHEARAQSEFGATYVSVNENSLDDLLLLSRAQHHITNVSLFGWWGAVLNTSAQKKIAAPRKWFPLSPERDDDLFSSQWLRY